MCVTYIDFSRFKACFGAGKVESIIIIKNSRREGEIKKRNGQYLSTKHQGTGLGIISAQKTAEKNGGSLITEATEKTFTAALFLKKNG